MPRFLRNWLERHQDPVSFWLHMVGIPMTLAALGFWVAAVRNESSAYAWVGAALFVVGYAVQFLGHSIEGNDAGELILFKRMLGMPYVAVVPRSQKPSDRSA